MQQILSTFRDLEQPAILSGKKNDKHILELKKIVKVVYKYSIIVPFIMFPVIYFVGIKVISGREVADIDVIFPWLILCVAMCFEVVTVFLNAQIEAFNLIALANKLKLLRAIVRSFSLWCRIYFSFNLTSIGFSIIASAILFLFFYLTFFKKLIVSVFASELNSSFSWSKDIWPLQWKTSISTFFGALILYNSSISIVFYILGPIEAGKFGITLAMIEIIIAFSLLCLNVVQPQIAYLLNKSFYSKIKQILQLRLIYSISITIFLGFLLYLVMILVEIYFPEYYPRFLKKELIPVLIFAGILRHPISTMAIFIRAHKSEYLMPAQMVAGIGFLILGITLTYNFGLVGTCMAYLLVKLIFHLPLSLYLFKNFIDIKNINFKNN